MGVHRGQAQKGVLDIPPILASAAQLGGRLTLDVVGAGEPDSTRLRTAMASACPEVEVRYHGALLHAAASGDTQNRPMSDS